MTGPPPHTRCCPQCRAELGEEDPMGLCSICLLQSASLQLLAEEETSRRTGRIFGDYCLEEEIARGGMGVVYRARQLSLGRTVAVKMMLYGGFAGEARLKRLRSEASAAAALRHPNVVSLFEVGELSGQAFLAMEYVPGPDLARLTRERSLTPRVAARYLAAVARGIHAAHQMRILHRDLKPSNILIDPEDQPRVTDFGLACRLDSVSELTLSGQPLGTPAYMPPEQVAVTRNAVGPWSDIYSLGAVLYHLLTSRPPFIAASVSQLFAEILDREPISPRALNASIPKDLETLCLKALSKDPSRRFTTALEFAEELERFLRHEPIRARPVGVMERVWRFCQRRPATASLTALAATSLVVAFAAVLLGARSTRQANERVTAVLRRAEIGLAEHELAEGKPLQGLSSLARLVKENPSDPVAATRLFSALEHRTYALPMGDRIHSGEIVWSSDVSADQKWLVTATDERDVCVWSVDTTGATKRTPQLVRKLNHPDRVWLARFDPSGALILTASADRLVRVWEASTGRLLDTLETGLLDLLSATFSPDGKWIAALTIDGNVRIWNSRTRFRSRQFSADPLDSMEGAELSRDSIRIHDLQPLSFSPDSRWLVALGPSSAALVWDVLHGELRHKLKHDGMVATACFSPDSRRIVTASSDKTLRIWDAETGRLLIKPDWVPTSSNQSRFNQDGTRVASALYDGTVRVWNPDSGTQIGRPLLHKHYLVQDEDFSPDGRWVLTASHDGTARIWDAVTGNPLTSPILGGTSLRSARFLRNGKQFATRGTGGWQMWDLLPAAGPLREISTGVDIGRVELCAQEHELVVVDVNLRARFFDSKSGRPLTKWLNTPAELLGTSPTWSIKSGISGCNLAIWERQAFRSVRELLSPTDTLKSVGLSPDASRLALGFASGRCQVHGADGRLLWKSTPPLNGNDLDVEAIQFSAAGQKLAYVSGMTISVVDLSTENPEVTAFECGQRLSGIRMSSRGRWLAGWGEFQGALLWNLSSPGTKPRPLFHDNEVIDAQFDQACEHVVTAGSDQTVRIWDLESGRQVTPPLQHAAGVRGVRILPGDRAIVSISGDGKARVWSLQTGMPLTESLPCGPGLSTVAICNKGEEMFCGGLDGRVLTWRIPPAITPAPDWLPDLAEALAGLHQSPDGVHERLPVEATSRTLEKMSHLAGDGFLDHWAQDRFGRHAVSSPSPVSIKSSSKHD